MAQRSQKSRASRGRSGGRAGGAGYDYQDLYVALQLAKLLIRTRDHALNEVLWEKRAVDWGTGGKAEPVFVDDVILQRLSGKRIYVQVKEAGSSRSWSAAEFDRSGVLQQFWREWFSKSPEERRTTVLRLASAGDLTPLNMLLDAARRSRTPSELTSAEAAEEVAADASAVAHSLGLEVNSVVLLEFLKAIEGEQLPQALELERWINGALVAAGDRAADLTDKLVRLVARSKHAGPAARASYTRDSLVAALQEEGVPDEALVAIGALRATPVSDPTLWDRYRARIVESFSSFRVYGLQLERAVYADLPALFVPLAFAPLDPDRSRPAEDRARFRRSLTDRILADDEVNDAGDEPSSRRQEAIDLPSLLAAKRRIAIVGGPGSGKTTTLKWLAIAAATPGEDGQKRRLALGLPAGPMVPLYVRFRQFAERVRARGLQGVEGRVGLVADFIGAQFEAGLLGTSPSRSEALQIAQDLLESENAVLLFDGLDEVGDEATRKRLFEAVADLIENYKAPRVVVSSRPYAFRPERSPLDVALYEPLPLDRAGRRAFAKQWYRSVHLHLGSAVPEQEAEALADDLAKTAEGLADLAEVPLLLSILALVHFNRQGLPVERVTLYDQATLAMLGHWDRDPTGRDLGAEAIPADWHQKIALNEAGLRRVVEVLARRVQCDEGAGEFGFQLAVSALAEGFGTVTTPRQQCSAEERAELLLRLLVDRSGLVQERSPGVFAFAHLSFQEYLTARWFVGRGESGVKDLARLADDERHAEVIRLAVAVLVADQRTEADDRARAIIVAVGERNPILAAASLLEAARLTIDPAAAADLARSAWSECSDIHRRHYHPLVASRLVWALLPQTSAPDELLLEFLSQTSDSHLRMEFEGGLEILVGRPPSPLGPALRWLLERLAATPQGQYPESLAGFASLLLVEAGASEPMDHLRVLTRVLQHGYWRGGRSGRKRDDPRERAARLLVGLLASDQTKAKALASLESTLATSSDKYKSWQLARLLLSTGATVSDTLADALVQGGLYFRSDHDETCALLRTLATQPSTCEAVSRALRRGARSGDNSDIRRGCLRVLAAVGELRPTAEEVDDPELAELARLRRALAEPETAPTVLVTLADDLWADEEAVVLTALRALLESEKADTPGVSQALVQVGLNSREWSGEATRHLREMLADSRHRLAVRAALFDGLRSDKDRVATSSALILLEFDQAGGERRLSRVVRAVLRDPDQVSETLSRIRDLLGADATRSSVLKAIGEYFGGKVNREVAGRLSRMVAYGGHFEAPNLAIGLVLGGLANTAGHIEVMGYLKILLDDPKLVADARTALGRGLSSEDARVAWGAAKCLWEAGARREKNLVETIIRVGLHDDARKEQAGEWLAELLREPRTARRAIPALEQAIYNALNPGRGYEKQYGVAWEIARCLIGAGFVQVSHCAEALVQGGLAHRELHESTIVFIRETVRVHPAVSSEVEEALFGALRESNPDVAWGAARTIMTLGLAPHDPAGVGGRENDDDDDVTESNGEEKRAIHLLRVLLLEAGRESRAAEALQEYERGGGLTVGRGKAWRKVLGDEDASTAYTAARLLLQRDDLHDAVFCSAIVRGGLTEPSLREEAARILDRLMTHPSERPGVLEGLNKSLWGEDNRAAWAAAVYMMDAGQHSNPGVPRGIVYGGLLTHDMYRHDAERRIEVLLRNPASRDATIDALGGGLYGEHRGERFNVASLLVRAGGALTDRVMVELGEAPHRWPIAPLALLALSGRVAEAREAATRLKLTGLRELLGDGEPT